MKIIYVLTLKIIFDNILLIVGGASGYVIPPPTLPPTTTLAPPSEYCYPIRSCPNNKWMCLDYCGERGFGKGVGTCVRDNLCCCIE